MVHLKKGEIDIIVPEDFIFMIHFDVKDEKDGRDYWFQATKEITAKAILEGNYPSRSYFRGADWTHDMSNIGISKYRTLYSLDSFIKEKIEV